MTTLNNKQKLLVEQTLPLVKTVVCNCIQLNETVQGLGFDDIYQIGCEALCHAALRYNPEQGAPFQNYAFVIIKNQLMSHCIKINKTQSRLCYLDDTTDSFSLALQAKIACPINIEEQVEENEIIRLLDSLRSEYGGITSKGIEALMLKCCGATNLQLAKHYGVSPNLVTAWISRASAKLRRNKRVIKMRTH